jgi:exodeoxyribonuclease VII large subunit
MAQTQSPGHIYTVTDLTRELKALLEKNFPFVWIRAEISNFRVPASGHFYFALKDENALIRAVMFRSQNRMLKFVPEDGMRILGLGRISLYPPRGEYQLIVEHLEPEGVGALRVAFEQLKDKLADEGLFDEGRKKPLPFLPSRICLVTSPTGSVLFDILHVLNRRYPDLIVDIVPVKVQGDDAAAQIAEAMTLVNRLGSSDVIILARGGGSLEDLWPFNTEAVARAIAASRIPVVSAVGHETDYTISDLVADVRAPTPSAAAEIVVPLKADLMMRCDEMSDRLVNALRRCVEDARRLLQNLERRLADPGTELKRQMKQINATNARLQRAILRMLEMRRHHFEIINRSLSAVNPMIKINEYKAKLEMYGVQTRMSFQAGMDSLGAGLQELTTRLEGLNPEAILQRGYSITRNRDTGKVITSAQAVRTGQKLEIVLAKGALTARTIGRELAGSARSRPEKPKGKIEK